MVSPPGEHQSARTRPAGQAAGRPSRTCRPPPAAATAVGGSVDDHQRMAGVRRRPACSAHRDRSPRAGPAGAPGWPARSAGPRTRAGAGSRGSPRSRPRTTRAAPRSRAPLPERVRRWTAARPVPHPGRHRHGPVSRPTCAHALLASCPAARRSPTASKRAGSTRSHVLGQVGVRRHLGVRAPANQRRKDAHARPHLSLGEATPHVVAFGEVTGLKTGSMTGKPE